MEMHGSIVSRVGQVPLFWYRYYPCTFQLWGNVPVLIDRLNKLVNRLIVVYSDQIFDPSRSHAVCHEHLDHRTMHTGRALSQVEVCFRSPTLPLFW